MTSQSMIKLISVLIAITVASVVAADSNFNEGLELQRVVERDDSNRYCRKPETSDVAIICNISRRLNVPFIKVATAQFIAAIDATAVNCSFNKTADFEKNRAKILSDSEIQRAYSLISPSILSTPPKNLPDFCSTAYNSTGPSSGKGRIFK